MLMKMRVRLGVVECDVESEVRKGEGYSGVGGVVEDESRGGIVEYEGMGRDKNRTVGFGEAVLGRVGYGRLGWVFLFFDKLYLQKTNQVSIKVI